MSYAFPKRARLRKRREFLRFRSDSKKYIGQALIIRYRWGISEKPRLGITIRKAHGKAYIRNKIKRRIREAFRLSSDVLPSGVELHISPKLPPKGELPQPPQYQTIARDIRMFAHAQHSAKKSG